MAQGKLQNQATSNPLLEPFSVLPPSIDTPENAAKARVSRARVRMRSGALFRLHEDLHAASTAEPDNPEAKVLLPQRSVNVEKETAHLSSNPTSVASISIFVLQTRTYLQTLAIEDPSGAFPTTTRSLTGHERRSNGNGWSWTNASNCDQRFA
ncbi:hypothetical protein K435DRAFT_861899 [Dendrothele bispora CBS 962.96]|uniref:Uncharacterized protein n=1 Tax=Dendrothele bispora (strain CBS 962.96) TaxID=1314807 RepID=A0A4S8LU49_DENBC|nr:hypothetical protein K435DRAFT_861899 [Dendrothele bispora CBS 962.96]